MADHEHEWVMYPCSWNMSIMAFCKNEYCKEELDSDEIELRLNLHEQMLDFIKYLYAGNVEELEKRYMELPQEIKDAIESHPVYGGK